MAEIAILGPMIAVNYVRIEIGAIILLGARIALQVTNGSTFSKSVSSLQSIEYDQIFKGDYTKIDEEISKILE